MSNIPADLRYAKSHEWLKVAADGTATVGITDYAQSSLGDITFIQLPKVGAALKADIVTARALAPLGLLLAWADRHRGSPAIAFSTKVKAGRPN